MLFIFLIGMISMTALASTTMLEQKQKTTIQKSLKHFQIVEIVQNEVSFITIDNTSIMERTSISYLIKERIVKQLAIIDDVGWNIIKFNKNITEPLDPKSPEAIEISELIRNFVKQEAKVPYSCETCRSRCHVVGYYHAPDCPSGVGLYHVQCSSGRSYECIYLADGSVDVYPGGSTVTVPRC